jgi:hypothetical protein
MKMKGSYYLFQLVAYRGYRASKLSLDDGSFIAHESLFNEGIKSALLLLQRVMIKHGFFSLSSTALAREIVK